MMILSTVILFPGCSLEEKYDHSKYMYPEGGRDTIDAFGNRRFAVLKGHKETTYEVRWNLYDRLHDNTIDIDIYNYKDMSPYVYAIGSKGYTKVNYETAEIKQSANMSDFSKEDQEIFKELDRTKNTVIKK